jgi:hypothetical protein
MRSRSRARLRALLAVVFTALIVVVPVAIAGDATPTPDEEYEKKIHAAQETAALGSNFTGEQVSLYDGSTTFSVTDVELPGNNALPVRIARRFKVEDRRNEGYLTGFGDWDIDLPRIQGVFLADRGWKLAGAAPYARCTSQALPDVSNPVPNGIIGPHDIWSGTYLYVPGQGDQELLVNDQPKLPTITDGQSYPWVTANFSRVRCLSSTASGYPGEAFVALLPDGTQYTFDWVVTRPTQSIKVSPKTGTQSVNIARSRVSFLPTRAEDRFGNWVTYSYSGDKLTRISASDGRLITLTWSGEQIQSVTANGRSWTYSYVPVSGYTYAASLQQVARPDGSRWSYSAAGTLQPTRVVPGDGGQNTSCPLESDPREDVAGYQMTIGHPSGATVEFDFDYGRTRRAHTPMKQCRMVGLNAPTPYAAHYWDGYILAGKTITGPGLATQHWTYQRDPGVAAFYTTGSATDPCPSCPQSKTVTVTNPDGSYLRDTFGIMYGLNEGKLLKEERGQGSAAALSTTVTDYVETAEVAAQRFPDEVGSSRNLVYSFSNRLRPVTQTSIFQQGMAFRSTIAKTGDVYEFDAFGRPLQRTRASAPYTPPQPPATAPALTVPASSTGNYTVSWTAVSGATTYALDESGNGDGWERLQASSARSRAISSQGAGDYDYRVQACNAVGCGPYSAIKGTTVIGPPGAPSLTMSGSQGHPTNVTWTAVATATSYQLESSLTGTYTLLYSGATTGYSYDQPYGSDVFYRVRACNANGCGAYSTPQDIVVDRQN